MNQARIIGGMFGLEALPNGNGDPPPFLTGREIFLANARSGIALLLEQLAPPRVWMPSYLSAAMLIGVQRTEVRFYPVDHDLSLSALDWLEQVKEGELVVLVDYFGFPCSAACARAAKQRGAWVLEDACQALLSADVGRFADFVLLSPQKFLGVPDAGILSSRCAAQLEEVELQAPPAKWWSKALDAARWRSDFDKHGGSRQWFELFQEAEATAPVGRYAMSALSKTLLMENVDYRALAERRVGNYRQLAAALGALALFPQLPAGVVPLGFPIRIHDRDRLRQALFARSIYPAVHWPLDTIVPEQFRDSHRLAAEIMTLPCDQRYGSGEMQRIVEAVSEEIGR
jgi:dTDP-4-amino-4,6-dideoxygalactose transaminase